MSFDRIVEGLQIADARETLAEGWEQSQSASPADSPHFLEPDAVRTACEAAYIPKRFVGNLLHAAEAVAENEPARALAWHAYWWMHETDDFSFDRIRSWPRLVEALGQTGALLYLLALIAGHEQMERIHQEHAIPDDVIAATLSQIALYLRQTTEEQGFPEVPPRLCAWLMNHYRGVIYRLARLQFQFGDSRYDIRVFRHRDSGRVLALSEDGVCFRADGQILRPDDDTQGSWEAELSVTNGIAVGHPIVPEGRALVEQVRLDLDDWAQVLAKGDPVLNIHIPGGEPMGFDQCGEAFERALDFFPRHFPDYQFNAFVCGSWILNTAIQDLASPDSNMVRFQREVYLFPIGLSDDSLPSGLFGGLLRQMPDDLADAPRDTSLQRAYLNAMQTGGVTDGGGGCFLLPEDVDWGAQVYRR